MLPSTTGWAATNDIALIMVTRLVATATAKTVMFCRGFYFTYILDSFYDEATFPKLDLPLPLVI